MRLTSSIVSILATIVVSVLAACGEVEPAPDAQTTALLTVTVDGAGTVQSSPAGIACGTTCAASYDVGTMVNLTATAGVGATFTGWTGACSGAATSCLVMITGATTVGAQFGGQRDTITVVPTGDGTGTVMSTPAGLSCPGPCTLDVDHGTAVTLTATAGVGSTFVGWTGAGCTGTGPCAFTAADDVTIQAGFGLNNTLIVTRAGTGTGTVTSSPPGIDCGIDCTETFTPGTVVTLTATPAVGSTFTGWSGACSGAGACTVTLAAAQMVTATFTLNTYTLTVTRAGAGTGTVTSTPPGIACGADCTEVYSYNTSVTLTAAAASGSAFTGWSGACAGTGACTVTMTAARSVTATFGLRGWLYAIRDTDDVLRRGNPDTGALTDVGAVGVTYAFGDCAWNPNTSTLFMVDGRGAKSLYRVSLTTGAATLVGVHNLDNLYALGYHPPSAFLYGVAGNGNLYRFNATTGAATLIGPTGVTVGLNGLTWDSTRSRFVAITASLSGTTVYSINTATGAATQLATGLPGIDNNGWTYDPVIDRLWAVDYAGNLYQYHPATFARTSIATGIGAHTCVAYVP